MRILFPELFFAATWFRGLRINGTGIQNITLWIAGYCQGNPVARIWFDGHEYVWEDRVI